MAKPGFVYIMASRLNGTIYVGVTSNLVQRAFQHRNGLIGGFTRRYGCTLLVWFECHDDLQDARQRELQIKKWKRDWKLQWIERENPDWLDLYPQIFGPREEGTGRSCFRRRTSRVADPGPWRSS